MNKDDILARSRQENRDKDLYAEDVNTRAATISAIVATLFATVLFVAQVLLKNEYNLALYAVILAVGAATYVSKAVLLKRKQDIILSILFGVATLVLAIMHFYQLIAG
ncbi:DUF6442 family protein [Eubacteriales bacterium OttesenSCG-928-N13]|nr:DUF6442 family protein [Eubacteriales bacterium OttesenSCG-928-N13]